MPTIAESLKPVNDVAAPESGAIPSGPASFGSQPPAMNLASAQPIVRSPWLRCPVPPQGAVSPDNLAQFYLNSRFPQIRAFIG